MEDDLAIRVSDSEPHISPVGCSRLLVLHPSFADRLLVSLLRRVVESCDNFTADVVDERQVDFEHD